MLRTAHWIFFTLALKQQGNNYPGVLTVPGFFGISKQKSKNLPLKSTQIR